MAEENEFIRLAGSSGQGENGDAPPRYSSVGNRPTPNADADELNSAFSSLNLLSSTAKVTPDTCLAHLKLLHAFQALKEDIGYTDGLWGLFDNRVLSQNDNQAKAVEKGAKLEDETGKRLAALREKRWALFVARAVDRYEAWWSKLSPTNLTESDMESDSAKYGGFTTKSTPLSWAENILPPLGTYSIVTPSRAIY